MDPTAQLNHLKQLASTVGAVGPDIKDEHRMQALQGISESLEEMTSSPVYPAFLEHSMPIFLKVLSEGDPQFLQEHKGQTLRKSLLEVLHRLHLNEPLKKYVPSILTLMFKLLEVDNEENVIICLKIVIELHKQFRPAFSTEIHQFLNSVKKIYVELPNNMSKIFIKRLYKVENLSDLQITQHFLSEVFTVTEIMSKQKNQDDSSIKINVIPKATLSLKVLAELPIIVVLMYQLYKQNVHQEVAEFIPHIMVTINLAPTEEQLESPQFNREVFVDFMASQIKTLSFLAYIVRLYQDAVSSQATHMISGMLSLFKLCPDDVAHLRKELLIAARHICSTDLKSHFVGSIGQLFDENILIGQGWTAKESLRPLAYSIVADTVHHIRLQLPLKDLASAVSVFSRNIHDESLPTNIQTMSCKLLMNLVEGLKNKVDEGPQARELMMRMLEVFVLKFQAVAELQIPALLSKNQAPVSTHHHQQQASVQNQVTSQPVLTGRPSTPAPSTPIPAQQQPETPTSHVGVVTPGGAGLQTPGGSSTTPVTTSQVSSAPSQSFQESGQKDEKIKFGFPPPPSASYTLVECRTLVKTLVGGIRTIVTHIPSTKATGVDALQATAPNTKVFLPKETVVFIRLVKYAMKALDVYMISSIPGGGNAMPGHGGSGSSRVPLNQSVRSKEEKEVLEHFAGVFQALHPQVFREVFTTMIDYVVERIHENYALQIVANSFLAHPSTSPIFATILVEYLLERMEDIGTNSRTNAEKSNLYLKLFKLVFGSVSLFALENEQMLKPHLHAIVNRSMELALSAKEPYNYFLLLRALFRSIGGGSHDLLYQEFLPLLPSLLQGLNSLQSGLHKQHMKDLFVELCLTVPVRLSSLLPYLPMLMDPLVSALNGSQTLVSQGLRTLELCVDNLQPDFLYDHIQPVRAELMQALWRTLRKPSEPVAHGSFRVLGKFGGGNRKMMTEPQKLRFHEVREGFIPGGSSIVVSFLDHNQSIELSIDKAVEVAFLSLKSSTTDPFYRKQCWEVIKGYLVAHMSHPMEEEDRHQLKRFLNHSSFTGSDILPVNGPFYKCHDTEVRKVHEMALTGMFLSAATKELRSHVVSFMVHLVRHYTLVAISQQTGPINLGGRQHKLHSMDPLVLIDAVVAVMGHEEKELCKPVHIALVVILDTATTVLGSKERASQLPLTEYLVEKMSSLCYERAWYAKLGGCIAIKFLFERMTLRWVFQHQYVFVKALFFVMMDLTGEVSSGAVDTAKMSLEKLLMLCSPPIALVPDNSNADLVEAQKKSLMEVTQELVRLLTSANQTVRQQAIYSFEVIAKCQKKTITEMIEPHRDALVEMIPPKKHVLRHQPVTAQIGIMDGNTFCMSLEPQIFTVDVSIQEHDHFFEELFKLCDSEDAVLLKFPCYKSVTNLTPLRKSAFRCIAACHHIHSRKDKIFSVLFKALSSSNVEIQQTGFECMSIFVKNVSIEPEMVTNAVNPLFVCISSDHRSLSQNVVSRLTYLAQLFPNIFSQPGNNISDKMLAHLKKWLEDMILRSRSGRKNTDEMKLCAAIINLFSKISTVSQKVAEILLGLVFKAEKALMMEPGSSLRAPLRKFLQKFPEHTLELLLIERNINEDQIYRFVKFLLKGEDGEVFRKILMNNPAKLVKFASGPILIQEKINAQQHAQQGQPPQNQGQQPPGQQTQGQAQPQPPDQQQPTPPGQQTPSPQSQPQQQQQPTPVPPSTTTVSVNYDLQYQSILITSILIKYDDKWLSTQPALVEALKKLWYGEVFHTKHADVARVDFVHWEEPKLLVKCLLNYFKHNTDDIELLFHLLRAFTLRVICDFEFFRVFLEHTVSRYPIEWKRTAFFKFVDVFNESSYSETVKAKILQFIIIPSFAVCFESGDGEALIGGPPDPDHDLPDNLISVFINKVIDPDKADKISSAERILMLQLACLLVDQASPHIHDAANKRQGTKLRRLMTFAWPCLLPKNCVDPTTKYHGHLLLAHIIAKFAIHKRIVLQVFHSLLKAYAVEARSVVRQALEVLTPAMPQRMEDGNSMLTHWTKKIIVEDGGTLGQLVHMLQLLVKHFKVYYPVRHHLIQHMVTSIQRLGFTPNASVEHKKIAVDLAEVIIRWEVQRHRESQESDQQQQSVDPSVESNAQTLSKPSTDFSNKPVDKIHADAIVNFLLRLACQVNEGGTNPGSPGEMLSRRCVNLLKASLKENVWPNSELKLNWFDKLLCTVDSTMQSPNYPNVCTALELLYFLLTILRKEQILVSFKPLQKGIVSCMNCPNTKVIRCVHNLLQRLMTQFPPEPPSSASFFPTEDLEYLYSSVNKVIAEGLSNFEKTQSSPTSLFSTLMILKAACVSNNQYIDRVIGPFMRVLQKMAKDHLSPQVPNDTSIPMATELLIISLDLVKNRIGILGNEMRKMFFQQILITLIEKSPDVKVLKAITKMTEDWVKQKSNYGSSSAPVMKEKALLLVRMMQFYEKRFPNEYDLLAQFLELVLYIYKDDSLRTSDITTKLEIAFMQGLRCPQPHIRARFFEVFDGSIRKRLIDRLLYIVCSQNWEQIGPHFWIKQCIELLLVTSVPTQPLESSTTASTLPSPTAVIALGDQHERAALMNNESDFDVASVSSLDPSRVDEEEMDIEISSNEEGSLRQNSDLVNILTGFPARRPSTPSDPKQALNALIKKENVFLQSLREVPCMRFLVALSQLCHMETIDLMSPSCTDSAPDSSLAYHIWVQLFPKVWSILSERQQQIISSEIVPFICSGSHVGQKDQPSSSIGCFVEGLSRCNPPIQIRPCVVKYLGKGHNLWHRSTLMMENTVFEKTNLSNVPSIRTVGIPKTSIDEDLLATVPPPPPMKKSKLIDDDGPDPPAIPLGQEALDCLSELYELLKEEDLWAGLWTKRAKHMETLSAISLEQQGFFEQAQASYELAMGKIRTNYATSTAPIAHKSEYMLWEKHWIRCSKELNQWETLMEYGQTKGCLNPMLVLESSWRLPNSAVMKDALYHVEHNCPKEIMYKVALFKGFAYISEPNEQHIQLVDRMAEAASTLCIKEWRRLPPIVSHAHLQLLQSAQQIMELSEAGQIHAGFLPSAAHKGNQSLMEMKAIVKTWRNRLPVLADDLSHWSDIFSWRQLHYQAIVNFYQSQNGSGEPPSILPSVASSSVSPAISTGVGGLPTSVLPSMPMNAPGTADTNASMLGVHASAQSIIYFGKVARKHGLTSVCLESLNRIHSIPSVPIVDCFQKIRQQLKCYLQMAGNSNSSSGAASTSSGRSELQEGLEVIESTNLKFFTKEMSAEFFALKGLILSQSGRSEEANKAFSAAAQLHDNLNKAWCLWGDYLEALFTKDRWEQRQMQLGVSAITCFLQACRHQNEAKSRKYLAKVLWMLTYDDDDFSLEKAIKTYNAGIPPMNWLPWIPQLLTWLVRSEGRLILEILTQVGRVFPQAVYFPIRTLYLTLKLEHREKFKGDGGHSVVQQQLAAALAAAAHQSQQNASGEGSTTPNQSQQTSSGGSQPSTPQPQASPASNQPQQQAPLQQVPTAMWRCSRIMHTQREVHPTTLHSLEGIVDQLVWIKENWYEEVLRQLKQALAKCYAVAFENRTNVQDATVSPNTLNFVKKVVSTFGVGIENMSSVSSSSYATAASESLARRVAATANDPVFQKMKSQFTNDFDFSSASMMKLHNLISKLKKWIKILEAKTKVLPKSMLIEEKCRFLSSFSQATAEIELPGEFLIPRHHHYFVRVARFMPRIEVVHKHNTAARRIFIRGHNGKIYPYLLVNDSCLSDSRREERVLQLLRLMNHYLGKQKETTKRFLSFTVPRVVAISPQTRLVEDNPASLSLLDIYKERCHKKTIDPDSPIAKYYDKLGLVQARGSQASHQVLRDILKDIQKDLVPTTLLKEWAEQTFPSATDYWTFRKQFTLQMALISMAEFVLHLTRLNPDMLYIHQDTGLLNVSYFRFDVSDSTGELEANRPVYFRLTHNLTELMTPIGVAGPLTASMISSARCLIQPNLKLPSILKVIMRDEVIAWYKKTVNENPSLLQPQSGQQISLHIPGEKIVQMVTKSVSSIMGRLQTLATFEGSESKAATHVASANSIDNLCRMDPAWHPWL